MLRILAAVGLAVHGLIHLIGFVVAWRLVEVQGFAYSTTAAWGRIELGDVGARVVGLGWLLAAACFVAAGIGVWQRATWAAPWTGLAAVVSLVLCVLGSPAAIRGVWIDVAILIAVVALQWSVRRASAA
jgi:hypothetical protein